MSHELAEEFIDSGFMTEPVKKAVQVLATDEWTSQDVPSKVTTQLTMFAFRMARHVGETPLNAPDVTQSHWQQALHNETIGLFEKEPFNALFEEAVRAVQGSGVLADFPRIYNNVLEVLIIAGSATCLKKAGLDPALLNL
jgi:hypothetical protein